MNLDPIEIEFLMNSTAVAGQSERVRQSLAGVDTSVENSKKKFQEITREQLTTKAATDGLSASFQNLSQLTAAYFTFQGAKSFLTDIINIRGEYQKTEIAFSTMLGSKEKAKDIISEMVELAAVTPFGFEEINNGAKQLLAYQVQAEDLGDTIERLGNISAGLSQPLSRLILVYGQVKAKGKLMGDDLRQFTEAGIPIISELAKVMNTTDSEVAKLVSNGEIGFDKVNKVIKNLTNEGGMFFNLMREQSKTIPGQIANIEDAIEQMFNKWGQKSEETISTALSGVSYLVENYESVLTVLGSLITTYGTYKAAVMTLNAIENVRNKTIVNEIANLSFAEKMKIGRVLVTERQAKASLLEAQAELAALQVKQASALAEGTVTGRVQASVLAKQVKIATLRVENAQEALSIAAKNASAIAESRLTVAQTLRAAATQLVARAQALLNATMLSNPIVAIVAVLGGLIYAYMQLRDVTDAQTKAEETLNNQRKETQKLQEDLKKQTQDRINIIKNETATILEQSLAFEELKKQYPETLKNMDLDAVKKSDLTILNKEFNKSIEAFSLSNQNKTIAESTARIEQLKANLKTLQESFTNATNERVISSLNREINKTNELLEVEKITLKKNQEEYNRKIELQKVATMTLEEQKKYWETQTTVLQSHLDILRSNTGELKNTNTQVNSLLTVSTQTSNIFSMWQIPMLLSQLDVAQQKVREISGSIAGENVVKNKAYWEEQRKTASGRNDALSGRAENPKVWDENIKLIREAEKNLKQYDYSQKTSAKTSKSRAKDTKTALEEIAKAERELAKMRMTDNAKEIADINDKYDKLRKQAKIEKLSQPAFDRIDKAETTEIGLVTYSQNTDALIKQLEKEKELYKLYEEAKTVIGAEEITKRYGDQLKDAKTFGDRLQQEILQITTKPEADRTGVESERLKKLLDFLKDYNKETQQIQDDKYLAAYEGALTTQERIQKIEKDFAQQRIELSKITDEKLRAEKLKFLEQQEKDAVLSVENEVYEKGLKERQLIKDLTAYTKRELQNRLKTTQEYLNKHSESLSKEQKEYLENEVQLINSIIGTTDRIGKQNALLKEKERITKAIKNNTSKDPEIAKKLNKELEDVNFLIDDNSKGVLSLNDSIEIAVQTAKGLADAFGSSNEELQRAVNTISNLVTSIAQGNMAGAVLTVVDWLIQGVKDVFGKDKEAEARRNSEKLRNQEEYNRMLREQLLIEIQLNDAYQSRVGAIKEQQEALMQNSETVSNRMKDILTYFNSIFNDNWSLINAFGSRAAWDQLGMDEYFKNGVELSDELLNKLIQLNAVAPLKGTLKELYEELMRLRDEYGSIEEAMRELNKEMINNLTGTTAQSLADSIKQGIADGKKSFADFADDIEGFLRNAILAGMSTKILEPQMQKLQDMLYEMMGDGAITEDERKKFQEMYMKIVNEANSYMDMINQAGIDITGANQANSLKGAIKGITEEQADLLAGQFGGLRLAQLETNQILKSSAAYQMQACSEMIKVQTQIEFNTRRTYEMLELVYQQLGGTVSTISTNSLTANGF